MTDKEKIRAEIEKRINTLEKNIGYGIGVDAQINAYACLLEFIDSMEKEPATRRLIKRLGNIRNRLKRR